MKARILGENLSNALERMKGTVPNPRHCTLPILLNVVIESDEGQLRLRANNLEQYVTYWIGARIDQEGAACVPYKALADLAQGAKKQALCLEINGDNQAHITSENGASTIGAVDMADYPPYPGQGEALVTITVAQDAFLEALSRVAFAVAREDSRPLLCAIHLEAQEGSLELVAADGFRLNITTIPAAVSASASWSVPVAAFTQVKRLADKKQADRDLTIMVERGRTHISGPSWKLVSQNEYGTFPNYQQLIPAQADTTVLVDAQEMLAALRAIAPIANEGNGIARLLIAPTMVTVSARGDVGFMERTVPAVAEIPAALNGTAKIAANVKYLLEGFGCLGDVVELGMTSPSAPLTLRQGDTLQVIMPMFVQW